MAGIFAPTLQSEVSPEQAVEQPSMLAAIAGLGGDFLRTMGSSKGSSSGSTKVDPNLATFQQGLERVQAIRDTKGEAAGLIAERQLASNFAMQGVEFGTEYKNVYTTTTGREWAGYGRDTEDFMRQQALQDPQVQASFIASYALLPQDSSEEQRIEYAIGQRAQLQAASDVIALSKSQAGYSWSVQTESAYGTAIDSFLNTNLGALVNTTKQGGRVGPQTLANLGASWAQLKVGVPRPSGVSDDQWKATQEKITSIDNLLSTLTKAASSDVLYEEITTGFANVLLEKGEGSTASILAAASAIKDPMGLANMIGADLNTFIQDVGDSINLDITQPQLFGHIVQQSGVGLGGSPSGNITVDSLPPSIQAKVEGLTPQQYYNGLKASGQLTRMVDTNALQRPEGRQQFVENAAGIGAVLMSMSNEDFLSASFLTELVGNPQFVKNVNALEGVDPEGATVARTYVRSGLTTELVRQQRNMAAIEATSTANWNGSNYVIDQDALATRSPTSRIEGFNRSMQKYYGGDIVAGIRDGFRGVIGDGYTDVLQLAGMYNLEGALDRRDAIGVINQTLGALAVDEPAVSTSVSASLIDRFEAGSGGYDTLFGQAQRAGKPFEGTRVSEKTLGELYDFSNTSGAYGAYVKGANPKGVLATPMGRYQFVGTTLKDVAKKMGLPDDTVFNKETQDSMFLFLARDVISGKSQAQKREALRGTWDGFSNATDTELNQMIAEIEGGNPDLGGAVGSDRTPATVPEVTTTALDTTPATQITGATAAPVDVVAPTTPVETTTQTTDFNTPFISAIEGSRLPEDNGLVRTSNAVSTNPEIQSLLEGLNVKPEESFTVADEAELTKAIESGLLKSGDKVVIGSGADAKLVELN